MHKHPDMDEQDTEELPSSGETEVLEFSCDLYK